MYVCNLNNWTNTASYTYHSNGLRKTKPVNNSVFTPKKHRAQPLKRLCSFISPIILLTSANFLCQAHPTHHKAMRPIAFKPSLRRIFNYIKRNRICAFTSVNIVIIISLIFLKLKLTWSSSKNEIRSTPQKI